MNYKKCIVVVLLLSCSILASSNFENSIKRAGLKALPTSTEAINKLIDPNKVLTPKRIALGKQLYFDTRLSKDQSISCASCHDLSQGGADGLSVSIGINAMKHPSHINTPTVYNAVLFERQFWDGRSPNLEDQAKGPILAHFEMGMTEALTVERINSVPEYVTSFQEAYGKDVDINFDQIAIAIAAFERTLITPSRFDDFLNGQKDALNEEEKEGLSIFIDRGCINCHTGVAIGGSMQPFAIANEFKFKDVGDFKGDEFGLVKVPSLRNVTLNSPYFHNGTVVELKDAIKEMSRIQLSVTEIKDSDIDSLIKFFHALEGRKPDIKQPTLPK
ncbi:MAG: cytochrome c peroxidase [Sulfurovum sp.]|nr:cytochrome c peroxidase [Sulfurovum sp.]